MRPRNYGEDNSGAVLAMAEGIKSKVEQLHSRLQTCVGNLELVSGSAGQHQGRLQQPQRRPTQPQGVVQNTRYAGPDVSTTPAKASGFGGIATNSRRSSDASALHDSASARRGSQTSSRPFANGASGHESWGAPGSDEVDWEDTPEDELDDGVEVCLDDVERLRGSGAAGRNPRYATADGYSAAVTPPPPSGVSVSAALQALKQNLSPHVRSSLKGDSVPTHGQELRSQYHKAVGDTIQRRLVGRADTFHTSGSLTLSPTNSVGTEVADYGRAATFPRDQVIAQEEGSPLRSLPVGVAARGLAKSGPESGRQLLNRPSLQIRTDVGPRDPLQPEDGIMSPSSTSRDTPDGQRPSILARSKIPPPPSVSRFAGGEGSASHSAAGSGGGAPGGGMSRGSAHSAGDGRQRLLAGGPSSPPALAAASSPVTRLHAGGAGGSGEADGFGDGASSPDRPLNRTRDQLASINSVNSVTSTGSGGLGWKFFSAESGGVMLVSVGSGTAGGDADHSAAGTPTSLGPAAAASPRSPFERDGAALPLTQSSGGGAGGGGPVIGFMPPPELLASPTVPTISSSDSSANNRPPVIGFVPPPEIMGRSSATSKAGDSVSAMPTVPSIGFVLPPELLAATRGAGGSAGTSSGGGAAASFAATRQPHTPGYVRQSISFTGESLEEQRPSGPTAALQTAGSVLKRAEGPDEVPLGSAEQELAARIPVGDFSFGINRQVFSSSRRLRLRSSGESVTGGGGSGRPSVNSLPAVAEDRGGGGSGGFASAALSTGSALPHGHDDEHGHAHDSLEIRSTGSGSVGGSRRWPAPTSVSGSSGAGFPAAGGLDDRGFYTHAHERGFRLSERHSSDVSGGPPSDYGDGGGPETSGRLPWEDSTSDEEGGQGPGPAAGSVHGDAESERLRAAMQSVSDDGEPAGAGARQGPPAPGSPFESAVEAAQAARGAGVGAEGRPAEVGAASEGGEGVPVRRPWVPPKLHVAAPNGAAPLQLSLSQEAMVVGSPDEEQSSPLPASGISVMTPTLSAGGRTAGPAHPASAHGPSPLGTAAGGGGGAAQNTGSAASGAAPAKASGTAAGQASTTPHSPQSALIQHRFSTGGLPASQRTSSSSQSGVSITITDADITRSGGLVPALLDIVRDRFRQKGFSNLAHLAATGGMGAGAAAMTDGAGSAPLSPALRGETLAERIVARVEHFQTRRADDLVSALMSAELEEVPRTRATVDGSTPHVEASSSQRQSSSGSFHAAPVVPSRTTAPLSPAGTRAPGSGIPAPPSAPPATTRFAAPTAAAGPKTSPRATIDHGISGGGDRTTYRASSERAITRAAQTAASTSASHNLAAARELHGTGEATPPPPRHSQSFHSPGTGSSTGGAPPRSYLAPFAAPPASPLSSAAASPAAVVSPAAAAGRSGLGAPAQGASPASSEGESSRKAERGTQTPPLPESSPAAGDGLPAQQSPRSTAQDYFLSTTVTLATRPGTRGGAVHDADDDRLLPPDSPTICTAADFFRGAASRATINTSTMAVPLRLALPAGASTISPFVATAHTASGSAAPGVSPRSHQPRSVRDAPATAAHPHHESSTASASARQRRQSASGRVSISTGGLVGRSGGRVSSSGGGRVMIDEAPVDMETQSSSRTYTYQPRRSGAGVALTQPASAAAGGHTVRVAFEESGPGSSPAGTGAAAAAAQGQGLPRDGGGGGAGGTVGRSLTREMLMRLAHLGRESRNAFETTTDEEREEQERQARRRARRNRSLAGQQAQGPSPQSRMTGEDGGLEPAPAASIAGGASPHGVGGGRGSALPRQLAVVAATEAASGHSSPAVAAAPGDLITLPPLSLDAPDMPEPGGGDALGCSAISPVGRAGAVSWSQLPNDTFLIPRSSDDAGPSTAGGAAGARRAMQSAGGASAAAGLGAGAGRPRPATTTSAAAGGGRVRSARARRSFGVAAGATTTTTSSCADSGLEDEDDEDGEYDSIAHSGGPGPAAVVSRLSYNSQPRHAGSAGATRAAAGLRSSGRDRRDGAGMRRGGDWDTEEDLPSVRFDSFEVDGDADGEPLDRSEPSPLSLLRGGVSPSSAAASVLSQRRYVAAARAHRSVSEANSAKHISSGALALDDDDDGDDGTAGALGPGEHRHTGRAPVAAGTGRGHGRSAGGGSGGDFGADATSDDPEAEQSRTERRKGTPHVGVAEHRTESRSQREAGAYGTGSGGGAQRHSHRTDERGADESGPATWRTDRGEEEGEGGLTPNGSRIRQSLQRLLDLRASAPSSARTRSSSSAASNHSSTDGAAPRRGGAAAPPPPPPLRGRATDHQAAKSGGVRHAAARGRPSPSPSVTATAGGTTDADAAARNAPLQQAVHGAADREVASVSTQRWRKARLLGLEQQRQRSAGSEVSSGGGAGDVPPEDPSELMSPNYTQDMAEEEYGWDAATGDADVDNLTSPRGRRQVAVGTPRGPNMRRGRRPPPPPLPYDPAEVPGAGVEEACPSFTRELEQQELMDAVSDLFRRSLSQPASEGSPVAAEQEPSFSLEPRPTPGRSGRSGGADAPSTASRRSSPSLVSGSWRGSPHSASSPADPGHQVSQRRSPGHATASPPGAGGPSPRKAASPKSAAPEPAASADGLPSWMIAILNHPRLSPEKPAAAAAVPAAAAAVSPPPRRAEPGSARESLTLEAAPPAMTSPSPKASAHAMRTALADLLAAVRPLAAAGSRSNPQGPSHGPADTASLTTMRISLEGAGAAGGRGERVASSSGQSIASAGPDPELRRLLLSAWSRWYLRKSNLGPEGGEDKKAAAAAAAAAQARLQALAATHSRAGSEAWDGISQSVDLQEAANISRMHITFTRWLGQARSARRNTYGSGEGSGGDGGGSADGAGSGRQRWAEPRKARPGSVASAPSGANNIAPARQATPVATVTKLAATAPARSPSASGSLAWTEAQPPAASPPRQSVEAYYYGATSPRGRAHPGAAAAITMPVGSRTDEPIRGYGAATPAPTASATTAARSTSSAVAALSTPTISRSSGVRQVPSSTPPPWAQPQQPTQPQPYQLTQPQPYQQQETTFHVSLLQQHHPAGTQVAGTAAQHVPSHVAAWLAGPPSQSSTLTHTQPRPATARSLLGQHPVAAVASPAAARGGGSASVASTRPGTPRSPAGGRVGRPELGGTGFAPAGSGAPPGGGSGPRAGDLESLMALQLLEGLGAGSDGVILAGLQLATDGAFHPDTAPLRPPSPRIGAGVRDPSRLVSTAPLTSPPAAAARPRSASTGRTAASPQQHMGLLRGGGHGGGGGGGGGSILERPLLAAHQTYGAGAASPMAGAPAFSRTPASPRVGIGTGGAATSSPSAAAGGLFGRGGPGTRPASPRPAHGSSGSGPIGYGSSDVQGGMGLFGSSSGGGSSSMDLLRTAPPSPGRPASPRPGLGAVGGAGSQYASQGVHSAALYGGGLMRPTSGSSGGAAARLQAAYVSPLRAADPFSPSDNIRAPEPGPDQVDLRYYGIRP